MRVRSTSWKAPDEAVTNGALDAIGLDELREIVRDLLPWLDGKNLARLTNDLIDRAARGGSGWTPPTPSEARIRKIERKAGLALREVYAEPAEANAMLLEGTYAFLGKAYDAAVRIFRAWLLPLAVGDFHIGQDELLEEMLGVDPATCAAQYVVARYMTAHPASRAQAVWEAIQEVRGEFHTSRPIGEMERVTVEPLPGFEDFLRAWLVWIQERQTAEREARHKEVRPEWLREIVQRLHGVSGLAELARSSRQPSDYQAWCSLLVEAGDWDAALSAFEEAARAVADQEFDRALFLDGAALAGQELGRAGLAERLEAAWRAAPTMERLRRWLGAASSRSELLEFARVALAACPPASHRQLAFLHLLSDHFIPAAALLSDSRGLGWSMSEHPGHLLFTAFCRLLVGGSSGFFRTVHHASKRHAQEDEPWIGEGASDRPRIPAPSVEALIERAGVEGIPSPLERGMVIEAMRTAAEKRLAGIVEGNRRSHYSHGAWLAVACVAVDESQDSLTWLAQVRESYRRRSALQKEFQAYLAKLAGRGE